MTFRPLDYLRAIRSVPVAELSASDRSVLVWMMTFANEDGRRAFPALETLADASGLSRATVMRATKRLRELGWISSVRTSRTASNEYELHTPAKYQGATSHGATSQSATSHGDTREVSGCNVAKYHGEPLSAQGSAHPPAQFALARSGGPPVKVRKPKKEPKHSLETIEAKTKILATFVESFERVKGVKPANIGAADHAAAFKLAKRYTADEAIAIIGRAFEDAFVTEKNATLRFIESKSDTFRGKQPVKTNGRHLVQPAAAGGSSWQIGDGT